MSLTALEVRAPYRGTTGYERHVREFLRELCRQGVAVHLTEIPNWIAPLPTDLQDPWFDALNRPVNARVVLYFLLPNWAAPVPGKVNGIHTMFEATRICPQWAEASKGFDLIIVPTESSQRAWVDSGVPPGRMRVCPLAINTCLFSPFVTRMPLLLESLGIVDRYRVRFLNVSANSPRKNLAGLVRAWIRATTRHDDAILVIKLSDYPGLPFESFLHRIALVQHELGKSLDEAAPLHFVRETFSDLAMARLYASFTHYISMSFGEGWDHPMVEAAASGLRLIAPGHSAYLAYLDSTVAHLIPCREVPAYMGNADQFLYEGANWWEPSEDDAIAFIRSAIEGRDLLPCSARDRVLREFSYEKVTRRLMDILEEFDPGPERRYL